MTTLKLGPLIEHSRGKIENFVTFPRKFQLFDICRLKIFMEYKYSSDKKFFGENFHHQTKS